MNKLRIIFIGGIHGVGKGTLCSYICRHNQFVHLSASQLIEWSNYNYGNLSKKVRSIPETQNSLLKGLEQVRDESKIYLLDGHYALLDSSNYPRAIDVDVFEKISPIALVLLRANSKIVQGRIHRRDRIEYPIDLLDQLAFVEQKQFSTIAAELKIPSIQVNYEDYHLVEKFIEQL